MALVSSVCVCGLEAGHVLTRQAPVKGRFHELVSALLSVCHSLRFKCWLLCVCWGGSWASSVPSLTFVYK